MNKRFLTYFLLLFCGMAFSTNFEKDPNAILTELFVEINAINLKYEVLIKNKMEKIELITS